MNKPVRVGMVGAGQLARMTHQAAVDLGIELSVLAKSPSDPAVLAGAKAVFGDYQDVNLLLEFAKNCDVVTFDHELVPYKAIHFLEENSIKVRPGSAAFMYSQDKLYARVKLQEAGFPVPAFTCMGEDDINAINSFADKFSWPVVAKSRSGGYDGRGVWVITNREVATEFFDNMKVRHGQSDEGHLDRNDQDQKVMPEETENFLTANSKNRFIIEEHVDIAKEIAILGVRRQNGQFLTYTPIETIQQNGICNELFMPADISETLAADAKSLAAEIARHVRVIGLIAIEMFITTEGKLIINELALRPHNSGHATIEASYTSQFQNHLRAVLDWPLGSVEMKVPSAAMVNILGSKSLADPMARIALLSDFPAISVHMYAKEPVFGRKLGHVTAVGTDTKALLGAARQCAKQLVGE